MAELSPLREIAVFVDFDKLFNVFDTYKEHVKSCQKNLLLENEIDLIVSNLDALKFSYTTIKKCWDKLEPDENKESLEQLQGHCENFAKYLLKTLSKIKTMLPDVWSSIIKDLDNWGVVLESLEANQNILTDKISDQTGTTSDSYSTKTNTQEVHVPIKMNAINQLAGF